MTKPHRESDPAQKTRDEIFVREVEDVIRTHDPDVIRVASAVGARLPYTGVDPSRENLVFKRTLREQIAEELGRVGSRSTQQ